MDDLVQAVVDEVLRRQGQRPALLVGRAPQAAAGWRFVTDGPYEAVILGSLTAAELLRFPDEASAQALLEGKPVYYCPEGLDYRRHAKTASRALWSALLAAERRLRAGAGAEKRPRHGGGGPPPAAQRPARDRKADAAGARRAGGPRMRAGLVLGAVWATKKSPALTGQSLLRVRCGETEYLAADLVGAGPGDRVILAFGAAARAGRPDVPVDAAIVAILDETEATHG